MRIVRGEGLNPRNATMELAKALGNRRARADKRTGGTRLAPATQAWRSAEKEG
jgi:hypothetical protein